MSAEFGQQIGTVLKCLENRKASERPCRASCLVTFNSYNKGRLIKSFKYPRSDNADYSAVPVLPPQHYHTVADSVGVRVYAFTYAVNYFVFLLLSQLVEPVKLPGKHFRFLLTVGQQQSCGS